MWAGTLVVTSPAFDEDWGFVPRIEAFPVQPFISQCCSVTPSVRQASAIPRPFPISISTVRSCPMISAAVYRVRAIPPPFVSRRSSLRI